MFLPCQLFLTSAFWVYAELKFWTGLKERYFNDFMQFILHVSGSTQDYFNNFLPLFFFLKHITV